MIITEGELLQLLEDIKNGERMITVEKRGMDYYVNNGLRVPLSRYVLGILIHDDRVIFLSVDTTVMDHIDVTKYDHTSGKFNTEGLSVDGKFLVVTSTNRYIWIEDVKLERLLRYDGKDIKELPYKGSILVNVKDQILLNNDVEYNVYDSDGNPLSTYKVKDIDESYVVQYNERYLLFESVKKEYRVINVKTGKSVEFKAKNDVLLMDKYLLVNDLVRISVYDLDLGSSKEYKVTGSISILTYHENTHYIRINNTVYRFVDGKFVEYRHIPNNTVKIGFIKYNI